MRTQKLLTSSRPPSPSLLFTISLSSPILYSSTVVCTNIGRELGGRTLAEANLLQTNLRQRSGSAFTANEPATI